MQQDETKALEALEARRDFYETCKASAFGWVVMGLICIWVIGLVRGLAALIGAF